MDKFTEKTIEIRSKLVISVYKKWIKKREKVLDVGCGNGVLSSILKKQLAISLTSCDIENYLKKDIPFVLMKKNSELPFSKNTFDVVMFNDILHHTSFSNQKKLLNEAFRIADRVVIFEDEPNWIETLVDWGINKFHNKNMPIVLTFRKHNEWMKVFKEMGINYEYKKIKRPFFYPLLHEAFSLSKNK